MFLTAKSYVLILILLFASGDKLYAQFLVNVTTDKKIYQVNSSLNIDVELINLSSKAHTLKWTSSCQAGYEIVGIYNQTMNQTCRDTSASLLLDPVAEHTWKFVENEHRLPVGFYKIVGEVSGYGKSDTVEIKIVDTLSSGYQAFYSGSIIDSLHNYPLSGVLITAEGADTAYSNIHGNFLLEFSSQAFSDSQTIHTSIKFSAPFYEDYSERIAISRNDSITGGIIRLKPHPLPFVSGHVYNDSSDVSAGITLYFYGLKNDRLFYTGPDYSGNYSTQLIPDSYYILEAISYNAFLPGGGGFPLKKDLYYINKTNIIGANIFKFSGDTSGIDFTIPTIQKGRISGSVIDAVTKLPLSNALITVASPRADSGFFFTDQNGTYSIQVFRENYILKAEYGDYFSQFYKDVSNAYYATPVVVDSNNPYVTGINFSLKREQIARNTILGSVKDYSTGNALPNVEVYAIPDSGGLWAETKSDTNGIYSFSQVIDGKYVLLFNKTGYISKYYINSFRWEDASLLNEFNGNNHTTLNSVSLIPKETSGGEISGKILTDSDSVLNYALVYAVNSSDSVVSTSISDTDGGYSIGSLPDGTYTIKADKMGYNTAAYPEKISLDLKNKPAVSGINIIFSLTGLEDKRTTTPTATKLFQNYPNPFNPVTTIKYELSKGADVRINIYNILGEKISELVNEYQNPGRYSVEWNAKNFASGIYLYTITAGSYRDSKKLILLK